jgi:hypothetical protein
MRRFLLASLLLVLAPRAAQAAIVVTQNPVCIDATSGTSGTVPLGGAPSAGDTVIVGTAGFDDRTISSVVDGNAGDAAAVVGVTSLDNSATFTRVSTAAFRVTTGHADITVNFSGTVTGTRICAMAVSGAANPVAFDTAATNFGDGPESIFDTGNVTSTTTDSILFAVAITSGFPGLTGDADFTTFDDTGNVLMSYKILSATGTHSYTFTSDGGDEDGHSTLVPLTGTGGGGGSTAAKNCPLLGVCE